MTEKMEYLKFENVLGYIFALGAIVFLTIPFILILHYPKHRLECEIIINFYEIALEKLLPFIISLYASFIVLSIIQGLLLFSKPIEKYGYFFVTNAIITCSIAVSYGMFILGLNHLLFHITENYEKERCLISNNFSHHLITPFAIIGIILTLLTTIYFLLYSILYKYNCFSKATFHSQLFINPVAETEDGLETIVLKEIQSDLENADIL
jgi:hypothetical protein